MSSIEIDMTDFDVTPFFYTKSIENIPKSEALGYPVFEERDMVEVRIAGQRGYSPHFPADAMWKRKGGDVITYSLRWAEQYRAHKEGKGQSAEGTPLEVLGEYGITPNLISHCKALKIYSVEALANLPSPKVLGMNANKLTEAAQKHLTRHSAADAAADEIIALRAEIERLKAGGALAVPEVEASPEEIDAWEQVAADPDIATIDRKAELKDEIERLTGARPKGNPSEETLSQMLEQAKAA